MTLLNLLKSEMISTNIIKVTSLLGQTCVSLFVLGNLWRRLTDLFYQFYAVSRTQQGRQRESSVCSLLCPEFLRPCMFSGGTQRCALPTLNISSHHHSFILLFILFILFNFWEFLTIVLGFYRVVKTVLLFKVVLTKALCIHKLQASIFFGLHFLINL